MRKPVATLDWLLSRPCKAGKRAAQAAKAFSMPNIGDNELRVMYLKRMGYGFKAIGKRIGVCPVTTRNWLIRAGFTCDAGTKSPAFQGCNRRLWGIYVDAEILAQQQQERRYDQWMLHAYSKNKLYIAMNAGKSWGTRNPIAAAKMRRRYESFKYDPLVMMVRNVRTRVGNAIRRQGLIKDSRTLALLGCSWDEYMTHIFNQLTLGMTWENFGTWHIDHIVPINTFDLSCPIQRAQAFHWSNTRPLWASENWARPKDGSDLTKKQRGKALRSPRAGT